MVPYNVTDRQTNPTPPLSPDPGSGGVQIPRSISATCVPRTPDSNVDVKLSDHPKSWVQNILSHLTAVLEVGSRYLSRNRACVRKIPGAPWMSNCSIP